MSISEKKKKALIERNIARGIEIGKKRIWETKLNNFGTRMTIIEYYSAINITVKFDDEFKYEMRNVTYSNFKKGSVKNPYDRILYEIGYIGVGDFEQTINRKDVRSYDAWRKMFSRCYDKRYLLRQPTYEGCIVCEEWHNFQNFAKWYEENYYECDGYKTQLDKDWLIFGNKEYSPENCIMVPSLINSCILTHNKIKYNNLPDGMAPTDSKKFNVRLSMYSKRKDLGIYDTLKEAMMVYKDKKIEYVKELAYRYQSYIPQKLFEKMLDYKKRFLLERQEYQDIEKFINNFKEEYDV